MPKKTGSRSDHGATLVPMSAMTSDAYSQLCEQFNEKIEQLGWEIDNLQEVTRLQAQSIVDLVTAILLLLGRSTDEKLKDPAIQKTMKTMMEALHQKQDIIEDLESRLQDNEKPQP